jgi:hypothetical protein
MTICGRYGKPEARFQRLRKPILNDRFGSLAALPIHTSLMSAIGGKADITIEFKARVVLSLDAKLQNYSLWIWAILVIAGRAIKHHKNKKNNNANNWDQRNEQPPT